MPSHHERELAERVTHDQHEHHDLCVATLHAHLDHDNCMESVILRGPTAQVRAFAEALIAKPGVRHQGAQPGHRRLPQPAHSHGDGRQPRSPPSPRPLPAALVSDGQSPNVRCPIPPPCWPPRRGVGGAWIDVIQKMDEVYSDLLQYEVALEEKNAKLEESQGFILSVLTSISTSWWCATAAGGSTT